MNTAASIARGIPLSSATSRACGTINGMDSAPETDQRARRAFGRLLWRLADLVQASDRRRSFRARAFRTAVWSLDSLSTDLAESAEEMIRVEGIGPGIIRLVEEFRRTGTVAEFDRLRRRFPSEVGRIARLPRITPGRLEAMKQGLGVDTVADLLAAIEAGAASTIEGVGPATLDRWSQILSLPPTPGAVPAHQAAVTTGRLRHHLLRHVGGEVLVAGEVRRLEEWVRRVDLVVVTDDPERLAYFLQDTASVASSAVEAGWAIDLITHDRIPVAVRMSDREGAGTALVRWTGPQAHLDALGLNEATPQPAEEAVYKAAGTVWVPPPARRSEIGDSAAAVGQSDIAGDLHVHTDWSPDGHLSLDEIAEIALELDYQYLAITDHTFGLRFGGLDTEALSRQRRALDETRARYPGLRILHGAEVNIDRAGVPDLDDETLKRLDLVVAGCHSNFDLPRDDQTARLVAAVRHPAVKVLAHPTGRRIGIRPGFDVDLKVVYEAAAQAGTALEVNGHRDRMDLSAENASAAVTAGVRLAADSDAHRVTEFDNMTVAVGVAQRAGLRAEHVVNTLDYEAFMAWVDT